MGGSLVMSRSYTSRASRPGEADGVDYNFVSRDHFEAMIARGEFLEWADVFGDLYGTSAADTERMLERGVDVVLVIDVQGERQVRDRGLTLRRCLSAAVVRSARGAAARAQQGQRGRDPAATRGRAGRGRRYSEYDDVVVNDAVSPGSSGCGSIVTGERARLAFMRPEAESIVRTFS